MCRLAFALRVSAIGGCHCEEERDHTAETAQYHSGALHAHRRPLPKQDIGQRIGKIISPGLRSPSTMT